MKIPDIATPFVNGLNKFFSYAWLYMRQFGLLVYCLFRWRKVNVGYFESLQQALIQGVPAYLCWDARYYYKVCINGINVTFHQTPILYAKQYTGTFTLEAWGVFSKQTVTIQLEVKEKYVDEKYKPVQFNYEQRTGAYYHHIERDLLQIKVKEFRPRGFEIKFPPYHQYGLQIKNDHIIDDELLNALQEKNTL